MTKSLKFNNKIIMAIAVVLCIALIGGVFAIFGNINAAAAEEYDDVNPVLQMAEIDSDLEASFYSKGIYTQQTVFDQSGNNAEGGKYHINTNAYCVWVGVDDVAFAYKKYNACNNGTDYVEAEVTIPRKATATGIKGAALKEGELHQNASIGIMFRSGLEPDNAEAFIHLRGSSILVVYRSKTGQGTGVQYTGMSVSFPMQMKMIRKGNQLNLYYKFGKYDWLPFKYPVSMSDPGPTYVGLGAHSCEETIAIDGDFQDFKIKGVGSYSEEGGGGEGPVVSTVSKYTETDPAIGENTLIRETFTDGSITEGKEERTNPIWNYEWNPTLENIDGNIVWYRNFLDEEQFITYKTEEWYDYEVSCDVQFTNKCNPDKVNNKNTFSLMGRHSGNTFYGRKNYAAVIQYGHELCLYKRSFRNKGSKEQGLLCAKFDLRELPGNEYYAEVNVYTKTEDTDIIPDKLYYTYSKSNGYSQVAEPKKEELGTYYDATVVKSEENTWTLFGDGKFHRLKLRMFDNKISVSYDGVEYLTYTDEGETEQTDKGKAQPIVHGFGDIGIGTYQTDCYVDNIEAVKLEDKINGEYDNIIEGNWDTPVPDYLISWKEATQNDYLK